MSDNEFSLLLPDEAATARLGRALAATLTPPAVVALVGTLGAGKTRLVQALAEGLGVNRRDVLSPTFVLVHEYQGRVPTYHLDAYRLASEAEFLDLGADEFFDRQAVTCIEWADRVAGCLPEDHIVVRLEVVSETARQATVQAMGARHAEMLARLRLQVGAMVGNWSIPRWSH